MFESAPNDKALWIRVYRLVFGLLALLAVFRQVPYVPNVTNFFSYFTIQSNIIGALVLVIGALCIVPSSRMWDLIRGAAAIYLILTGVIYNTLLLNVDVQISEAWINNVLHRIMPLVMLLDLLVVPWVHRIRWREATVWSLYPLAYLAYAIGRGTIVDWYPYPFLDPRRDGGYPRVALFSVAVLIGFLVVTWLITELVAWRQRYLIESGAGHQMVK